MLESDVVLIFDTDTRMCAQPTFGLDFFVNYVLDNKILYMGAPFPTDTPWCEPGIPCCCNTGLSLWNQHLTTQMLTDSKNILHMNLANEGQSMDITLPKILKMCQASNVTTAKLPCGRIASLFSVQSVFTGSYIPLGVQKPWSRAGQSAEWQRFEKAALDDDMIHGGHQDWSTLMSGCPAITELGPYALSVATKQMENEFAQGVTEEEFIYNTFQAQAFVKWQMNHSNAMPDFNDSLSNEGCPNIPDMNPHWMMHGSAASATAQLQATSATAAVAQAFAVTAE